MTDLPPRTTPPRADDRRLPAARPQTSMWIVLLVVAAVLIAAVAFTLNRSGSVVDQTSAPAATETPAVEGTGATTETTPVPDAEATLPAETAPGTSEPATPDPATPAPSTNGTP